MVNQQAETSQSAIAALQDQAEQQVDEPQANLHVDPAVPQQNLQAERQNLAEGQAAQVGELQAALHRAAADQQARELDAAQQQLDEDLQAEMAEASNKEENNTFKYRPGAGTSWEQAHHIINRALYKQIAKRTTKNAAGDLACTLTPRDRVECVLDHLDTQGAPHRQATQQIEDGIP